MGDKNSAKQIFVYLGYFFGVALLLLAIGTGFLYISPGTSIFGVSSVNVRQVYTTYMAEGENAIPGVSAVLESRNIIIESKYIPVEVRIRNPGQQDVGSIQVLEDSSGLTVNNVQRTYLEFSQVLVEQQDGDAEIFYKIKVIEPQGTVSRSANNYVFINMYPTDSGGNNSPFNFILNTGGSNVKFAADDASTLNENPLFVNKLEILNASGSIYLPPETGKSFHVEVKDLVVSSRSVKVNCESPIRGDVSIDCNNGSFVFKSVGGNINVAGGTNSITVNNVGGNVSLVGKNVKFSQRDGAIEGSIIYEVGSGALSIVACQDLYMRTADVTASVSGKIKSLDYEATGSGGVNIAQVGDVGTSGGFARVVTVKGGVTLNKLWVNTGVQTASGAMRINFDKAAFENGLTPTLAVRAYDGAVNVTNICGEADILVRANGNANVTADFLQVVGESKIFYEGSTNPYRNKGMISVTFVKSIKPCRLFIERMASAHNKTNPTIVKDGISGNQVPVNASLSNGLWYLVNYTTDTDYKETRDLTISTSNGFSLFSRN